LFTDHSFHNLGVPRNWNIVYNLDSTTLPSFAPANGTSLGSPGHHYYDLGLCGPVRTDLSGDTRLCGLFKVPTLRNVAIKQTYFHNGVYNDLHQVVGFYATRDSNLARIYVKPDGSPDIPYNDLPQAYDGNVERRQAPFNQTRGPSLTQAEVQNLVSFLCTLTDGYDPKNPSAYRVPPQCH
jgi:cytochrome c peroxidase